MDYQIPVIKVLILLQSLQNTITSVLQGGKMPENWKRVSMALMSKEGQGLILTTTTKTIGPGHYGLPSNLQSTSQVSFSED